MPRSARWCAGRRVMSRPWNATFPARTGRSHDAVDRRRLPGAVAADEADSLAVLDGERDTAQDLRRPAEGVDPLELEHHSRHQWASAVPMSVVRTASLRRISSGVPSARIVPWCMATIRY